jgi:uroporphyrinogen decarboxylase
MTPRERFNNQMHYKPVDRCFNMEFGYWEENYQQWDLFTENGITNEGEANLFFAFDPIAGVWGNTYMSPGFGYKEIGRENGKVIIQNNEGLIAEVSEDSHSTIPHFIKSSINDPDDWERVKEEKFRVGDPARVLDVESIKAAHPDDRDYPLGIDCGSMIGRIRDMLTFEGICYFWGDYPETLEDMVETCCVLTENVLDQVLGKVQFDYASGWEDICFNYGPILPPSFFREVIGPRYKRLGDRLHKHGIDIWYTDCDGDVRPILPIFLDNGINCLFPYEVNSCAHPGQLLDEYADRGLRIMGGIDKMKLIEGPEAIKAYLESVDKYVKRGGYIPFCDHRCPPDVSPANYVFYLKKKKKMWG